MATTPDHHDETLFLSALERINRISLEFQAALKEEKGPRIEDFLGELAAFPEGPFLLPMVLGLPTVLTLALKTGPNQYDVFLELLADGQPVARRERPKVLQERIESYAARLEQHCLRTPFQWFNFYDFWAEVDDEQR